MANAKTSLKTAPAIGDVVRYHEGEDTRAAIVLDTREVSKKDRRGNPCRYTVATLRVLSPRGTAQDVTIEAGEATDEDRKSRRFTR